jgi:two-component system response regulator HupR/HoxA
MAQTDLPSFHGIIGRSPAMLALFRRIGRVALFDVPVLICGETGTGKELVARAIWQLGARRDRRFEAVNAGALNRELLLSELFGHERGAFTGAVVEKQGLLAVADGGTVFLDEVGDLPLDAQVMLLRFIQSGEIRPVGSTETRRVNVRLIAATHRDLDAAVERGTFREDLYYRLRRAVLEVPPLRARGDDIRLLVEHLRVQLNERYGLSVRGATPAALRLLEHYPWRGNVRELEAVLEQAMIFKSGDWITPEELDLPMPRIADVADCKAGAEGHATPDVKAALSWLQHEALRIVSERREVRRRDIIARCRISREVARRELAGLVRLGLLRRVGAGRGARYVPLSFWLTLMAGVTGWATAVL